MIPPDCLKSCFTTLIKTSLSLQFTPKGCSANLKRVIVLVYWPQYHLEYSNGCNLYH